MEEGRIKINGLKYILELDSIKERKNCFNEVSRNYEESIIN